MLSVGFTSLCISTYPVVGCFVLLRTCLRLVDIWCFIGDLYSSEGQPAYPVISETAVMPVFEYLISVPVDQLQKTVASSPSKACLILPA